VVGRALDGEAAIGHVLHEGVMPRRGGGARLMKSHRWGARTDRGGLGQEIVGRRWGQEGHWRRGGMVHGWRQ
jgi:hypothetical protein